jgi:hypothetical protein
MGMAIISCRLDLTGRVVLTEAATGAYAVTPVLAALAGAERVIALAGSSRHGPATLAKAETLELATAAGMADRIEVVTERRPELTAAADVVTNSGHVRPIDAQMVSWMKTTAVVPLMFEAWELLPSRGDLDLVALRRRGIMVAGTNERHPAVDVFSYLGVMACKLLLDAGVAVHRSKLLLLCDNPFSSYLRHGLAAAGATVEVCARPVDATFDQLDAVVVALRPRSRPVLDRREVAQVAKRWPGAVVAQFWGDLDRTELAAAEVPFWPLEPPRPGQMGILPSAVGPEPTVRLQAGGLKVAEVLLRPEQQRTRWDEGFVDALGE